MLFHLAVERYEEQIKITGDIYVYISGMICLPEHFLKSLTLH